MKSQFLARSFFLLHLLLLVVGVSLSSCSAAPVLLDTSAARDANVSISQNLLQANSNDVIIENCQHTTMLINITLFPADAPPASTTAASTILRLTVRNCVIQILTIKNLVGVELVVDNCLLLRADSRIDTVSVGLRLAFSSVIFHRCNFSEARMAQRTSITSAEVAVWSWRGVQFEQNDWMNSSVVIRGCNFDESTNAPMLKAHRESSVLSCIGINKIVSRKFSRVVVEGNVVRATRTKSLVAITLNYAFASDDDVRNREALQISVTSNDIFADLYHFQMIVSPFTFNHPSPLQLRLCHDKDYDPSPNERVVSSVIVAHNNVTVRFDETPNQGDSEVELAPILVDAALNYVDSIQIINNDIALEYINLTALLLGAHADKNFFYFRVKAIMMLVPHNTPTSSNWRLVDVSHNRFRGRSIGNLRCSICFYAKSPLKHLSLLRISSNDFSQLVLGPTPTIGMIGLFVNADDAPVAVIESSGRIEITDNKLTPIAHRFDDADLWFPAPTLRLDKNWGGPGAGMIDSILVDTDLQGMEGVATPKPLFRNVGTLLVARNVIRTLASSSSVGISVQLRLSVNVSKVQIADNVLDLRVFRRAGSEQEVNLIAIRVQAETVGAPTVHLVGNNRIVVRAEYEMIRGYAAAISVYMAESYGKSAALVDRAGTSIVVANNSIFISVAPDMIAVPPLGQITGIAFFLQCDNRNMSSIVVSNNNVTVHSGKAVPRWNAIGIGLISNTLQVSVLNISNNIISINASVSANARAIALTSYFGVQTDARTSDVIEAARDAGLDPFPVPPLVLPAKMDDMTDAEKYALFNLKTRELWFYPREHTVLDIRSLNIDSNDIKIIVPRGGAWMGIALLGGDFVSSCRIHNNSITVSSTPGGPYDHTKVPSPVGSSNYFVSLGRSVAKSPVIFNAGVFELIINMTLVAARASWTGPLEIRGGRYIAADSGVTLAAAIGVACNESDIPSLSITGGAQFSILRDGDGDDYRAPPPTAEASSNFALLRWSSAVDRVKISDVNVTVQARSAAASKRCFLAVNDNHVQSFSVMRSSVDMQCADGFQLLASSYRLMESGVQPLYASESQDRGRCSLVAVSVESSNISLSLSSSSSSSPVSPVSASGNRFLLPVVPFCATSSPTTTSSLKSRRQLNFTSTNIIFRVSEGGDSSNDSNSKQTAARQLLDYERALRMLAPSRPRQRIDDSSSSPAASSSLFDFSAASVSEVNVRCFAVNSLVQWKRKKFFAVSTMMDGKEEDEGGGEAPPPSAATATATAMDKLIALNFVNPHDDRGPDGKPRCAYPVLPNSQTKTRTATVSIVPKCAPFTFVVNARDGLSTDRLVSRRHVWLVLYLVPAAAVAGEKRAPPSAGRIVPPTPVPAGEAQSEAVTVFSSALIGKKLLARETGGATGGAMLRLSANNRADVRIADAYVSGPKTMHVQIEAGSSLRSREPFDLTLQISISTLACRRGNNSHSASSSSSSSSSDGFREFAVQFASTSSSGRILSPGGMEALQSTTSRLVVASALLGAGTAVMRLARARALAEFDDCQFSDEVPSPLENAFGIGFGRSHGYWIRGSIVGVVLLMFFFCAVYLALAVMGVYLQHLESERKRMQKQQQQQEEEEVGNAASPQSKNKRVASIAAEAKRGVCWSWLTLKRLKESLCGFGVPSKLLLPACITLQPAVSGAIVFLHDRNKLFSRDDKIGGVGMIILLILTLLYLGHVIWVQIPRNKWLVHVNRPPRVQVQAARNPAAPLLAHCPHCSRELIVVSEAAREQKERRIRRELKQQRQQQQGEEADELLLHFEKRPIQRKPHNILQTMYIAVASLRDFHCYWKMARPPPLPHSREEVMTREEVAEYERQRRRNPDPFLLQHAEEVFPDFKPHAPWFFTLEFAVSAAVAIISGLHPAPLSSACDNLKALLLVINFIPFLVTLFVQPFGRYLDFYISVVINGMVAMLSLLQALVVLFPSASFISFGVELLEFSMEMASSFKSVYDIGDFVVNFMPIFMMMFAVSKHVVVHVLWYKVLGNNIEVRQERASQLRTMQSDESQSRRLALSETRNNRNDDYDDADAVTLLSRDDMTRRPTVLIPQSKRATYRRVGAYAAWTIGPKGAVNV